MTMGGSEATNGFSNGQQSNTDASTRSLHVLIVGGGLGGLSTAIAASLAGHRVTVLEAASKLSEVGAGIQLTPNVTRLLRRWGVFESLEPVAVKPSTIYFRRWQTGRVIGITDLETFEDNFGAPYWVVHRAHLHQALVDRAVVLGAKVIVDSRVSSVDFDQATVTASNKSYSADLIVGCDGLKSVTRASFLGGKDAGPQETPFCAYRATVPMDQLLSDPDLRSLVEKPDLSLWIGEGRHVMSYPINGGKTFNMVLSHPDTGSTPSEDEILQEMKDNYIGWDPRLTKIISLIDKTAKWKLMTYPRLPTWRHPSGRFVLLGDACHAMLPYMSQGAAQAMEDAASLGRCLARAASPKDLPTLTAAYEKIRMERAYAVQARSALNGRIWHYPDGADQKARDAGMADTLTKKHYLRSTNQWSNPGTQVWLYGHDAERAADRYLDELGGKVKLGSGVQEMVDTGLLVATE